jgi:soluble lytic murein transglycosylase-like protein
MVPSLSPRVVHRCLLVAAAALLCGTTLRARADVCAGPLPDPDALVPADARKFALIESGCEIAPGETARTAAQLALYELGPSTISMSAPADAPVRPAAAPPPAPLPASGDRDVDRILSVEPNVIAAAHRYGVDPRLLHAIVHVESRHRSDAVSPAGALGLTQVMPATARRFGIADPERSLFDPDTNLRACAAYLQALRIHYGDDLPRVLAAYNAGEDAVDRHGGVPPYAETRVYVRDVLAVFDRLTATFGVASDGTLVARGAQR